MTSPATTQDPGGEDRIATEFLARYRTDQAQGRTPPLRHYLSQFPDAEEVVAREFLLVTALDRSDGGDAADDPGVFGPFVLRRLLGRGGQGTVHLAEDTRLGRLVALKVLRDELSLSRMRFVREAFAAARLDHPGICAVYETGHVGGRAYLAMRYVHGPSLASRLAVGGPMSAPEACTVVAAAAEALHVAHEAQLVHRDVKPANLVLGPDGPVVLDFGLALDETGVLQPLTPLGEPCGTPSYMSPEQIASGAAVDRRTDVWSLGVVLWQCLTGERPFDAPTRDGVCLKILHQDAEPPRRLPRDLRVILRTALAKEPRHRYASAAALAEDLRRFLAWQPIRARPPGLLTVARRFAQRNPVLTAALVLLFATLAGGLLLTRHFLANEIRLRQRTESAFADVRSVARMMVFDLDRELRNVAGATRARRLALERGKELFERLYRESDQNPQLQRELAIALVRFGDVLGHSGTSNLADTDGAMHCYRRAAELAARVRQLQPDAQDVDFHYAMAISRIGDLQNAGSPERAMERYRQALAILDASPRARVDARYRQLHATIYYHTALCRQLVNDGAGAVRDLKSAIAELRALVAEHATGDDLEIELGGALGTLGQLHMEHGDYAAALSCHREACDALAAVEGDSALLLRIRSFAHMQLGRTLFCSGQRAPGLREVSAALALRTQLHARDPDDHATTTLLCQGHVTRGDFLRQTDPAGSATDYRQALALAGDKPLETRTDLRRACARAWLGLAELAATTDRATAGNDLALATRVVDELWDAGIRDPEQQEMRDRCRALAAALRKP